MKKRVITISREFGSGGHSIGKNVAADEVKREMVVLASLMAGKVVNAAIDTTVQDTLIEETLKEMGESTWLS